MKLIFSLFVILCSVSFCFSQQPFYDVTYGNGNGIRFWQNNNNQDPTWRIQMGNQFENLYGPVTDYSIKTSMDGTSGRGWVWGVVGSTPVAALNNQGNMQIAGKFTAMNRLSVVTPVASTNTGSVETSYGFSVSDNTSSTMTIRSLGGGKMHLATDVAGRKLILGGGLFEQTLTVNSGGNVGIGTTVPSSKLVVFDGNSAISMAPGNVNSLGFNRNASDGAIFNTSISAWQFTARDERFALEGYNGPAHDLITILKNGNVGIGVVAPDAKLAVSGQIHATEVKVTVAVPGPDYVFEKDYSLPTLESVKTYIDQNKHLPEVPSAKEMEANGINLSEMNMLLLKKVEELTLYVIESKKEMDSVKKQNEELKSRMDQIEKK